MVEQTRSGYSFDLVTHLVAREFRLRYRNALMGWLWALAEPLARLAVLAFVFTRVVPLGIPHYPAVLFTGIIAWTWFSAGLVSATTSVLDRRDLILRPGVPRLSVPVVSVLTGALDYLVALPVLLIFVLLGPGISATVVALPVVMAVQLLLMVGIGCLLATAHVFLRDVRHVVGLVLTVGFYVTPVFFRADVMPERFQFLVSYNPMARLIIAYRDIVIEGQLPALGPFLALVAASVAVCLIGCAVFVRAGRTFADEL